MSKTDLRARTRQHEYPKFGCPTPPPAGTAQQTRRKQILADLAFRSDFGHTKGRPLCIKMSVPSVELRGFRGATHQQGFSEHSLRKPLARANAQPASATSPRQPSRVRIPKLKAVMPRHKAGASPLVELRGFEPLTFSLRTRRATNCAIAPRYSQKPKRVTGKFANYEAVGLRSRKITRLRPASQADLIPFN